MKIGVLIKQVPARDTRIAINSAGTWIDETGIQYETSEADEYALEAALQLKESLGGDVVAISLGPERVQEALRTALAKGADSALRIDAAAADATDPLRVATALAGVIRDASFDLVLSGLQSDDLGYGQTPVLLAELLDLPHATMVVGFEHTDSGLKVRRELEGGWFQDATLPLPAVLTIQSGINKPRYTALRGIMAAKRKPLEVIASSELLPRDVYAGVEVTRVFALEQTGNAEMLQGAPAEQAAALIERLRYSERVLS